MNIVEIEGSLSLGIIVSKLLKALMIILLICGIIFAIFGVVLFVFNLKLKQMAGATLAC